MAAITYTLKKELVWDDMPVKELEISEVTGEIIYKVGKLPLSFKSDGSHEIDMKVFMDYLSHLTAQPLSLIKRLAPVDLFELMALVIPFFTGSQD